MIRVPYHDLSLALVFFHDRRQDTNGAMGTTTTGFTRCDIHEIKNGKATGTGLGTGYARCVSSDNFNKETGRKLALGRALKLGGFSREERTAIWKAYHNRSLTIERPTP